MPSQLHTDKDILQVLSSANTSVLAPLPSDFVAGTPGTPTANVDPFGDFSIPGTLQFHPTATTTQPTEAPVPPLLTPPKPAQPTLPTSPVSTPSATVATLSTLSELLTPAVLAKLSHRPEAELMSLSLSELLAEVTLPTITGPWQMGLQGETNVLIGEFLFAEFRNATAFQMRLLCECDRLGHHPLSIGFASSPESDEQELDEPTTNWLVSVTLGRLSGGKPGAKDLQLAQFANYIATALANDTIYGFYPDHYYTDPQNVEQPKQTFKDAQPETIRHVEQLKVTSFSNASQQKFLKVPFARIGEWQHPSYGTVSFTQTDFDEMQLNFNEQILGYEPPLFLGHPVDTDTMEGHRAEAFLAQMVQEDDVLYGIFEVVNEETYGAVLAGQYRYCSGEFIRNYTDKVSGQPVGTTCVGVALTNRPFLTQLPRVSAMAEHLPAQTLTASLAVEVPSVLQSSNAMTTNSSTPTAEVAASVVPTAPVIVPTEAVSPERFADFQQSILTEFAALKQMHAEHIAAYATQLETSQAEVATLRSKADFAETQLRQAETNRKLEELNSLSLPQEVKTKYSEMISNGSLGANEAEIFSMLRSMSATTVTSVTRQYGHNNTTEALNDPAVEDPYKAVIERNQSLIQAREQRFAQMVANANTTAPAAY